MACHPGRIAFVFAGGSALASVQVGMLRPLLAAGLRPDLVVGSSAGALNGAATAADPGSAPATLERLWTTARRSDVLPVRAPTVLRALAGRAPGFASAGGIRQVIERHLTVRRIEDTAIPFFWRIAAAELARWAPECDLYVLPSPPIAGLHPLSPKSARQLIDDAERMTREWLPRATTWRQDRPGKDR